MFLEHHRDKTIDRKA